MHQHDAKVRRENAASFWAPGCTAFAPELQRGFCVQAVQFSAFELLK